jgi:hypothetical protein
MTKKLFKRWLDVLKKAEKKNKEMLKAGEITKEIYILLNKVNSDKYEAILNEYNK